MKFTTLYCVNYSCTVVLVKITSFSSRRRTKNVKVTNITVWHTSSVILHGCFHCIGYGKFSSTGSDYKISTEFEIPYNNYSRKSDLLTLELACPWGDNQGQMKTTCLGRLVIEVTTGKSSVKFEVCKPKL